MTQQKIDKLLQQASALLEQAADVLAQQKAYTDSNRPQHAATVWSYNHLTTAAMILDDVQQQAAAICL